MDVPYLISESYHELTSIISTGLLTVAIHEALLIALCSHAFHYNVIIIMTNSRKKKDRDSYLPRSAIAFASTFRL